MNHDAIVYGDESLIMTQIYSGMKSFQPSKVIWCLFKSSTPQKDTKSLIWLIQESRKRHQQFFIFSRRVRLYNVLRCGTRRYTEWNNDYGLLQILLRYGTVQTLSTAKSLKVACKTLKLWTKSYSCFASHFTFRRFIYPKMIQWTMNKYVTG